MNPFFFGTSERRLFGLYEPAQSAPGRARAAVLCNPWGPEYVHAHRSLRQLAARLAAAGHHTLRFDYFATGDSAGEAHQGELAGWVTDTLTALEELRDIAGSQKVALIGLRLGANVAARAAARRAGDVEALVLWDPIRNGAGYLNSLRQASRGGFPLPPGLETEIAGVGGELPSEPAAMRSLILCSEPEAPAGAAEHRPAPAAWDESATVTGAVPVSVLQRIVDWLG